MINEKESLSKHTINLYEGDFQLLQDAYPEVGAGIVIRKLIRKHLRSLNAHAERNLPPLTDTEIDL